MSVYFLHYTEASENEFGRLMSIAAVGGTILNISISSLSDRYRAHRLIYLLTLIVTYSSVMLLFGPILMSAAREPTSQAVPDQEADGQPIDEASSSTSELFADNSTSSTTTTEEPTTTATTSSLHTGDPGQRTIWFYIVSLCIALGTLGIMISQNFSESFSANLAKRCSQDESYGSIRFFGALGWCLASLVLILVDKRAATLPYLFVGWLLFACLMLANIIVVLVWPDKEPFNLSSEQLLESRCDPMEMFELGLLSPSQSQQQQAKATIHFGGNSWRLKPRKQAKEEPIGLAISFRRHSFDSPSSDTPPAKPELRRCSIAALGSSHVIEQFQIAVTNTATCTTKSHHQSRNHERLKRWPNERDINGSCRVEQLTRPSEHHFKHITKIQPLELAGVRRDTLTSYGSDSSPLVCQLNDGQMLLKHQTPKPMSFRLHLKIIELIARRNKNMIRFLALYAVVGFIVAMNWYFLFPYLEMLDGDKFVKIAPYVMMSGYLSETLFYFVSPKIPLKVRPSIGLSLVLFVFAVRYSAYLTFSQLAPDVWPLELIVVVELLQSMTIGWFDCILNESAVEFALEAEHCLPKLIELNLVDDSRESAEMVKNSVKLSLVSVSSCFYDGVGVALGSLFGGWIIVKHDYTTLWSISASLGLLVGIVNLLLEWTVFRDGQSDSSPPKADGKLERAQAQS